MSLPKAPLRFIAIQECSDGNAEVGSMWFSTATFNPDATVAEVWQWAKLISGAHGRLMIQPDENCETPT